MPYFITDSSPDCSGWATIKEDGEVIGCHTNKQDAIDQMVAVSIAEGIPPGGERDYDEDDDYDDDEDRADAPAPKKDQITGSDKYPAGSAAGKAGDIDLNEATNTALQNKATEHNEDMASANRPEWTRVRLGALKSVYRRGSGAYSTSHRPGVSRAAWSMARVNAFLYLARNGRPRNAAYVGDNDLLHKDHPRYSESKSMDERVSPNLPEGYRPASNADVPANRNCGNCGYYKNFYCKRWDALVSPAYYCNKWEPVEGLPNDNPGQTVQTGDVNAEFPQYQPYINTYGRQLSFDVPAYIRSAARRGLDYYGQGLAGDGLVARTVREARDMAAGRITEDKVIRANAWGKRHLVDLEAPQNSNADNDGFPGKGAVAFYLWGINPLDPSPAMDWFERQAERIREEEDRVGRLNVLLRLSKLFVDK
jgi:hypothetical protein